MAWRSHGDRHSGAGFKIRLQAVLGEYSMEACFALWGVSTSLTRLTGHGTSNAISALPPVLAVVWAILMLMAAVTVLFGLFFRQYASTVGRGVTLFGTILNVYAIAIFANTGMSPAAVLLALLGCVCLVRGGWLKRRDAILIEQMRTGSGRTADL